MPENATFRADIELANGTIIKDASYVEFTDTRIALTNGAWNMRAYVDNRDLQHKLLAGQYVSVYIKGICYLKVFSVPQAAVMQDDKGQFVFVIEQGKALKRYIKPGKMYDEDLWMIREGLNNGDIVITKGNNRIKAGQSVVVDHLKAG